MKNQNQTSAQALDTSKFSASYDYTNQAWIADGVYLRCGHPDFVRCDCYGRLHEGEPAFKPYHRVE